MRATRKYLLGAVAAAAMMLPGAAFAQNNNTIKIGILVADEDRLIEQARATVVDLAKLTERRETIS